jgi:hypothetical protein
MNAVCREMALGLAEGAYRVTVLEHVEGRLNFLPDYLSRLCEPGSAKQRPVELVGLKFTGVERRSQALWRTWLEPSDGDREAQSASSAAATVLCNCGETEIVEESN